ncbi:GntR family transcriptional regulator [Rhodococcus rhodnii]|uniref:Transcriptional regulator n=2 Tax=Rhodococcus rhodnii TaxID=38312 RepID=R7WKQ5_9NOCA|nr:GntR family transcriptional regulator [Rhodococcus rhodnii]EOM75877.1 transcriptional regulator [Rhodococcus rhodnii LMG 5362]TXG91045.1 GntR family transcriptional regulator [Rhodococcus rhodnii]
MLFRIDHSSAIPLAEQIAGAIRGALARGELTPGDRLPTARTLANSVDVGLHTVLRAYAVLRDEGLIEVRRGRGATVTAAADSAHVEVREAARRFVESARRVGMTTDLMTRLVEETARS